MTMHRQDVETFPCPHCGEAVKVGARICRSCGANDECGWNDDDQFGYSDGEYSQDDFDYDDFVANEFPDPTHVSDAGTRKMWLRLVILALLAAMFLGFWAI